MRKLTIGMCVYDDFEGFYFTIQSLRLHHREVMNDVEFVIVNNNPHSKKGNAVRDFIRRIDEPIQYYEFSDYSSTSLRNKIFELADTPYVLCLDCHVMLNPGSIKQLIEYYDNGLDEGNLLQGPLLHDDMKGISTHFDIEWGEGMLGKWGFSDKFVDGSSEPFEIPGQGLGLFSCRKDSWLGFNKLFRGFGGEEIYIHEKYRKQGKKAICLPFLLWVHRFIRVDGIPYPNKWEDRYHNYIVGRIELEQDALDVDEAFSKYIPEEKRNQIKLDVIDKIVDGVDYKKTTLPIKEEFLDFEVETLTLDDTKTSGCGCGKG